MAMVARAVPAVVEAIDLHRTYRTTTGTFRRRSLEVEAVRGVSFEIQEGELFGLLGPNGAGKTTTIKMLITLLIPTSGRALVLGRDVVEDARWVRERIGYVFGGDRGLYERLSALDNLRYFAELYGVDPKHQRARIDELFEMVGLEGREKERVEGYSRGMRQRASSTFCTLTMDVRRSGSEIEQHLAAVALAVTPDPQPVIGDGLDQGAQRMPRLIVLVAGLALMGPLANALTIALQDEKDRMAATVTFAATASGLTLFGIGSAFWGLAGGLIVLFLDRLKKS